MTPPDDPAASGRRPAPAGPGTDDRLLRRVRPWALRQAERAYGHLPEADRVAAVDAALRDLRRRGMADDPRAARAGIADDLTARLRAAHVAWCERPGGGGPAASSIPRASDTVETVVERGLGGLERAVLQLELGAGRDTRTARAALRLGVRDYARHRREGLAKLRIAVGAQVTGHVCAGHAGDVTLAATGDDAALERLRGGPERCRSCAREAEGLRRLLHQRLALAPWPLTIQPLGALAAKLAGVGAAAGGSAAAGSSAAAGGSAAVAGGGSAAAGGATAAGGVAAWVGAAVLGVAAVGGGLYAAGHDSPGASPSAGRVDPVARASPAPATAARPAAVGGSGGARARRTAGRRVSRAGAGSATVVGLPVRTGRPAPGTATPPSPAPTPAPTTAPPAPDVPTAPTDDAASGGTRPSRPGSTGGPPVREPSPTPTAPAAPVPPSPTPAGPVTDVTDAVTGTLGDTTDAVTGTLGDTTDTVTGTLGSTTDTVTDTLGDTTDTVTDTLGDTTDTVTGTLGDTTDTVTGTLGDTTDTVTGTLGGLTP